MSKIEDLIKQYCPNGVEFKELGEILDYEQPSKYIVKSTRYENEGTPVLTAGQTFILGYTSETDGIYMASKSNPVIIFDDFTTSFHWVDFNFKVKSSAMKMLRPKQNICFKYVYFAMKTIKYSTMDHARQWISQYSKIKIPVPPLPVQKEIVLILDSFIELEKELERELEKRKQQYEYYRNKLFVYEEKDYKVITDIANTFIGLVTTMTKHYVDEGVKLLNNCNIKDNHIKVDKQIYLDEEFATQNESRKHKLGDIITVHTGDVGTSAVITEDFDGSLGFATIVTRIKEQNKVLPKFIAYYLNSNINKANIQKMIKSDRNNLNLKDFNKLKVPTPPIEEQERIVSILDKFDAMVNDISIGLPAEINARRQQYEHYKNKLLTFKEIK